MQNKCILPVKPPIITTYPDHTNYLSAIETNESVYDWIYSNFIQLSARKDMVKKNSTITFTLGFEFTGRPFLACPWLKTSIIYDDMVQIIANGIIEFVKNSINKNYYVSFEANRYHLKCDPRSYLKNNFIHTLFVYGYNNEKEEFYVADFFENSKYQSKTISYGELENSYNDYGDKSNTPDALYSKCVTLFKLEKRKDGAIEYNYNLDIKKIHNSLEEYLLIDNHSTISLSDRYYYGLNIYYEIEKLLISKKGNQNSYVQNVLFHVLFQHKYLMRKRVEYINKYYSLFDFLELLNQARAIEDKSLILRNLCIKYDARKNEDTFEKMLLILRAIKEQETIFMKNLIKNLIKHI